MIAPVGFGQVFVGSFPLVLGIVLALLLGKAMAAGGMGRAFGYSRPARLTLWALTLRSDRRNTRRLRYVQQCRAADVERHNAEYRLASGKVILHLAETSGLGGLRRTPRASCDGLACDLSCPPQRG